MLEDARAVIARLVEVQQDDVIFTSGATESNALAILGVVRALRLAAGLGTPGRNNMHVLYLPSAHASIVENMRVLEEEGIAIEPLPIKDSRVDVVALATLIRKETVLVSMDAVCGETGVVWNTREVAETLHHWKVKLSKQSESGKLNSPVSGILLHVDASQAPLTEKISRAHFDANLITFDASKVSAARGCGALVVHRTIDIVPLYKGGGQERGVRPGSEAPELAQSFAASLACAVKKRESFRVSAERARARLIRRIIRAIPDVLVNEGRVQVPNILNLSFPGRDTDYLVALLDEEGFAVSTRSACETDSDEGSRAVLALTSDADRARSTLRISWGPVVGACELTRFSKALARAVAFVDKSNRG